jgi:hypothetical protein
MVVVLWLLVDLACLCADLGADVGLASGVRVTQQRKQVLLLLPELLKLLQQMK